MSSCQEMLGKCDGIALSFMKNGKLAYNIAIKESLKFMERVQGNLAKNVCTVFLFSNKRIYRNKMFRFKGACVGFEDSFCRAV